MHWGCCTWRSYSGPRGPHDVCLGGGFTSKARGGSHSSWVLRLLLDDDWFRLFKWRNRYVYFIEEGNTGELKLARSIVPRPEIPSLFRCHYPYGAPWKITVPEVLRRFCRVWNGRAGGNSQNGSRILSIDGRQTVNKMMHFLFPTMCKTTAYPSFCYNGPDHFTWCTGL